MEENNEEPLSKQYGVTNGLTAKIADTSSWHVYITKIDLSARNIKVLDDKIQFPTNIEELNLSHNTLEEVPAVVLSLEKLKTLNLSHNAIRYFDETPNFCHSLELLDISKNSLYGPPYWIWTEKPKLLIRVNLSGNVDLTKSFIDGYFEELMQYKTAVLDIDLYNCSFNNLHTKLLSTFTDVKTLNFGIDDYSYYFSNTICEVPSESLRQCCALERLNLTNTHVYTIDSDIDLFTNLCELNLASNNINGLPNELCNLANLETCVLSCNKLLYLPEEMYKLTKLVKLCVDSNELCMLPGRLLEMKNLKILDLYDNHLHESLEEYSHLAEFDIAQNYMDEPNYVGYLEKKETLRLIHEHRSDGRKMEVEQPDSEYSSVESEEEEYYRAVSSEEISPQGYQKPEPRSRSSSPEDWDSDAHWVPHNVRYTAPSNHWLNYIHKKIHDGNFCPIDAHVNSISDQVLYEKSQCKQAEVECIGQFDDYSSDES